MTEEVRKLARSSYGVVQGVTLPILEEQRSFTTISQYHETVAKARFFYENDSIAGTVINRMSDLAITELRNRHRKYKDEIKNYYDGIAEMLAPLLAQIPLLYLIDGMAVAEYRLGRIMGNRIHNDLGRTRYYVPEKLWLRNVNNIELKKGPMGERFVYIKIPQEDIQIITTKGKPDREDHYRLLVEMSPDYVKAVQNGQIIFKLDTVPICRKLTPYNTYPIPFLKSAIPALEYRRSLKRMDKITSERVIESLRHVKVGSDEYPADDDDIIHTKNSIEAQTSSTQDTIFNVYTNHTIEIKWVIPPIDNLLDDRKYSEANADVLLALGFPRIWVVGENERSNSSDNSLASIGPVATLNSIRNDILLWVKELYRKLAEENGFTQYPDPYWSPINIVGVSELLQYAANFMDKAISRNTVSQIYGTTYDREKLQMEQEDIEDVQNTAQTPNRQVEETAIPSTQLNEQAINNNRTLNER
jgi:hypothetical protein